LKPRGISPGGGGKKASIVLCRGWSVFPIRGSCLENSTDVKNKHTGSARRERKMAAKRKMEKANVYYVVLGRE